MRTLIVGLAIGACAGILDALPMLLRGMPRRSIASAFCQWLTVGLTIVYIRSSLPSWASGLAAGLLLSVPVVILVSEKEPASAPMILGTSAVLGALCGLAAGLLVR
jgi:hypothetical protein